MVALLVLVIFGFGTGIGVDEAGVGFGVGVGGVGLILWCFLCNEKGGLANGGVKFRVFS